MKANFIRHTAKGVAVGIAAAVLHMASPALAFTSGSYDIVNHPDGALSAWGSYGLRLDNLCYHLNCGTVTNDEKTFSAESGGQSTVWLDWGLDGNLTTARIHGTLEYNDTNPTKPDLASSTWTIEYNLTNIEAIDGNDPTNGWRVKARDPNASDIYANYWVTGTLTNGTGMDATIIHLKGKNDGSGYAFVFDDDPVHRCDGLGGNCAGNPVEARGWMKSTTGDPNNPNSYWKNYGANDWLVIANPKDTPDEIPEPGTLALFGLGLVGIRFARRQRAA